MNLQADAMTRATQIATNAMKSKWRDEGRKLSDFHTSDHRKAIAEHLAQHPEIIARAAADVAKFKTSAQRKAR
jgi:hypothetical protein